MSKKQKYEVVRAWDSAEKGSIVELADPVHPALRANVRKVGKGAEMEVATLAAAEPVPVPAPTPPPPAAKSK